MRNWKQKLAWISGGMTFTFLFIVIFDWVAIGGTPIEHAIGFLQTLWDLGFPEWMMLLVLSSMFVPLTRYFDLKFNLFGFNCKNTDDRSRCTYCGAAVNSISIVCPYCKKELPADIVNALKTESDKEKMKPVTKTETQVIVEYVVGAIFTILSALIYVILNPGSSAVVMGGMLGASSVMLLFTMVYVKWGFGKSLPSIKFFPRDNGFLVFSEFFLISQLISLYKAMS